MRLSMHDRMFGHGLEASHDEPDRNRPRSFYVRLIARREGGHQLPDGFSGTLISMLLPTLHSGFPCDLFALLMR
jgi:hypothetical protein